MRAQRQLMLRLQIVAVAKVFKDMLGVPDAIAYLERNGFSPESARDLLADGEPDRPASPRQSWAGEGIRCR